MNSLIMPSPFGKSTNPFSQPVDEVIQSEVLALDVAITEETKKRTKRSSRRLSFAENNYIITNFKEKNPTTIALELNAKTEVNTDGKPLMEISSTQVASVIRNARKLAEQKIAEVKESGDEALLLKYQQILESYLPKRSFRGVREVAEKKVSSIASIVDSLFST